MKTIAMYLPQFHNIPENDEWWGEGFTDWVAARNGKKLSEGHYQPHVPLGEKYYDLIKDEGILYEQAEMMHRYGIDAMCFYHYYFKDGKKLLEKPAEKLLANKDIDMSFCFSWANESWVRSWSNIKGNPWYTPSEDKKAGGKDVLALQEYGDETQWEEHFDYLLPFFQDERYVKIDGKPLFIIYQAQDIDVLGKMRKLWEDLAIKNGFPGLFILSTGNKNESCDGTVLIEPVSSKPNGRDLFFMYEEMIYRILKDSYYSSENTYFCGFPSYDDTPRRGRFGKVYAESTPEKFYMMMKYLYYLSDFRGNEMVFINAWNEWGEGMHLEPDMKYGYGYLEQLKRAKDDSKHLSIEEKKRLASIIGGDEGNTSTYFEKISKRHLKLSSVMNRWMTIIENGGCLTDFFANDKSKSIAVYGIGMLGRRLVRELKTKGYNIVYGIDELKKHNEYIDVFSPDDDLQEVDIVVVTVLEDEDVIKTIEESSFAGRIVTLVDILNQLENTIINSRKLVIK